MRNVGLGLLVGVMVTVNACSSRESTDGSVTLPVTMNASETTASDRLAERTGIAWNVQQDAKGVVTFAAPALGHGPRLLLKRDAADAVRSTIEFFHQHRDVFAMRAPAEELTATQTRIDDLSMMHVRLGQVERGLPVIGGELTVHYDADGRLSSIHQRYREGLARLDIAPAVTAEAALATAKAELSDGDLSIRKDPRLVIFAAHEAEPVVAWETSLKAARNLWTITIDAHTGEIVDVLDHRMDLVGSGVGVRGVKRTVQYVTKNGTNQLVDATRPGAITLFDAKGNPDINKATVVTSNTPTSWDTASRLGPGSAVDAAFLFGVATDYYAKTFGRKSWDDKNGAMPVFVHVGDAQTGRPGYDNAYFSGDPTDQYMVIGDGDTFFKPLAGATDVIAHEYSHAVTLNSSNLRYANQSGALNESFSDIFGNVVEHQVAPDPVKNWLLGGDLHLADKKADRDMMNPHNTEHPAHLSEYLKTTNQSLGVHTNSSIPNHATFLMTMGGTNPVSKVKVTGGIGWENMAKVWYRANTQYLTESSDFAAAAKATLQAAADLKLAQKDVDTIDCAWKAVGVVQGECVAAPITPESTPATPGADAEEEPTSTSASSDAPADDDDDDTQASSTPKTSKKKSAAKTSGAATVSADGCNASRGSSGSSTGLLLVAALLLSRRWKRRPAGARALPLLVLAGCSLAPPAASSSDGDVAKGSTTRDPERKTGDQDGSSPSREPAPGDGAASTSASVACASATGATKTTVFEPTGATPDDDGDDFEAIQDAIDRAGEAGGGIVRLPAGRFVTNGHLVLADGVALVGAGTTTRIVAGPEFLSQPASGGGFPLVMRTVSTAPGTRAGGTCQHVPRRPASRR